MTDFSNKDTMNIDTYYCIMSKAHTSTALAMIHAAHRLIDPRHPTYKAVRIEQLCNNQVMPTFIAKMLLSYELLASDVPLYVENGLHMYVTPDIFVKYQQFMPTYIIESAYLPFATRQKIAELTGAAQLKVEGYRHVSSVEEVRPLIPGIVVEHYARSLYFHSIKVTLQLTDLTYIHDYGTHAPSIEVLDYIIDNKIIRYIPWSWFTDDGFDAVRHAYDKGLRFNGSISRQRIAEINNHAFILWLTTINVPIINSGAIDYVGTMLALTHYCRNATLSPLATSIRLLAKGVDISDIQYVYTNILYKGLTLRSHNITTIVEGALANSIPFNDARRILYKHMHTATLNDEEKGLISDIAEKSPYTLIMYHNKSIINYIVDTYHDKLKSVALSLNIDMLARYIHVTGDASHLTHMRHLTLNMINRIGKADLIPSSHPLHHMAMSSSGSTS